LAARDTGGQELATEEERQRNIRKSKLQNIQTKRALKYADKALQRFHAKIADLKKRGLLDVGTAREAAEDIAEEEFSRGTPAKEQAKDLFWEQVNREWPKP
jgi:hypothetical protein